MRKEKYAIYIILLFTIVVFILCGCKSETKQVVTSHISTQQTSNNKDYSPEELVKFIDKEIKFGMSKEDIVALYGKPDNKSSNTEEKYDGFAYNIKIDGEDTNLLYYFNSNNNLYAIAYNLPKEDTYNKYVDKYKTTYTSLVSVYGLPTGNTDIIENKDSKSYGYDVYTGKSRYSSEWDLDTKKITSFLYSQESDGGIKMVSEVYMESKEYVQ